MEIIKKEILEFNEKEMDALQLVVDICLEINSETSSTELQELVCEIHNRICELWGYEE